jgi:uncharacterized coiled-coil DUF342 family protein
MLILSIFVVVLGLVQIIMFVHFSKVNENIDKLFHEALKHEGKLIDCKNRLDAHYNDIVRNEKKIDSVEKLAFEASKKVETELKNLVPEQEEEVSDKEKELSERRNKFAHLRAHGVSLHDAADKMHISYSTAKRYEKWRVDNKK